MLTYPKPNKWYNQYNTAHWSPAIHTLSILVIWLKMSRHVMKNLFETFFDSWSCNMINIRADKIHRFTSADLWTLKLLGDPERENEKAYPRILVEKGCKCEWDGSIMKNWTWFRFQIFILEGEEEGAAASWSDGLIITWVMMMRALRVAGSHVAVSHGSSGLIDRVWAVELGVVKTIGGCGD